jgi:hypothetical protein
LAAPSPPRFIESDVYSANAITGIICRTDASRSAFIEHCYQEALAIIEENKPVMLALAQALIDHPERTLTVAGLSQLDRFLADDLGIIVQQLLNNQRGFIAGALGLPSGLPLLPFLNVIRSAVHQLRPGHGHS